ncbi:hypothetical protein G210_2638 [Candida maltosa Xu316]|uniref:Histone deacetylase domain-containing protein n=1 Tax=Candida maltosa (strain Xu316) TaxID=1245528 RepID=M3JW04_CANMX|nr:hypothetical protein G210_2638 [Candida maltosa Xu316]
MTRKVVLAWSDKTTKICDLLPSNKGRSSLVCGLIKAYGLDKLCHELIDIYPLSNKELTSYHDQAFINHLTTRRSEEADEELHALDEKFGLVYDCYPFPLMDKYVQHTAASSILTARSIIKQYTERDSNEQIVGINWYGGRHHCHKSQAAGYCYINDVILAINVLRKQLGSVFYLDLDLHHGDGVENGFKFSRKIATCSIHRYDIGFYPGTGSLEKSTGNTYNIPTKKGLTNSSMEYIIREIVIPLITKFDPKCIVIQAGCDGLTADEHKEWNMSIKGYANAIDILLNEFSEIPVMILGGGGYNHTEVAKCWTYITFGSTIIRSSVKCKMKIPKTI